MRLIEAMDFNADGSGQSRYKHRQLLLLDEFPSLGKLDIFQEALAFIAGYGLKALTRSRQPRSSPSMGWAQSSGHPDYALGTMPDRAATSGLYTQTCAGEGLMPHAAICIGGGYASPLR